MVFPDSTLYLFNLGLLLIVEGETLFANAQHLMMWIESVMSQGSTDSTEKFQIIPPFT